MLTEKYRPASYDDFVGDKDLLLQIEKFVRNDVPVIVSGPPGIGKTTMAYLIAKELGMNVIETNASDKRKKEDLDDFKRRLKINHLQKPLFLLDEVDGMSKKRQKQLTDIIKKSTNPIFITANDKMKIDLTLKKNCKFVELKLTKKHLKSIVDRIKYIAQKEGIEDANYKRVSYDMRQSINCVLENSQGYKAEIDNFEKVKRLFFEGEPHTWKDTRGNPITIPWILDNLSNFYFGIELYKALQTLLVYAETGNEDILACFPKAKKGKPRYPRYLRKRSKHYANVNG